MKTTLAVLITALFLLTTPMFALAYGGERSNAPQHSNGWITQCDQRQSLRYDRSQKRQWREKKHFWQRARQHRYPVRRYQRVYAAAPVVIYGVPQVVFRIDW